MWIGDATVGLIGLVAAIGSLVACGGATEDTIPIEDIPPDKPLVELSPAEYQGVCEWGETMVAEKLAGKQLECDGIEFDWRSTCSPVPEECPATVAEWQACTPSLLDRVIEDPCFILDVRTQSDFATFVEETPNCDGLGACGTTSEEP